MPKSWPEGEGQVRRTEGAPAWAEQKEQAGGQGWLICILKELSNELPSPEKTQRRLKFILPRERSQTKKAEEKEGMRRWSTEDF